MTAVLDQEAPPAHPIRLFGFQKGKDGFVRVGTSEQPVLTDWDDYVFVLAHGGAGSGKSRAGAYRMLHFMLTWDRCFGIVTCPTRDMLRTSTLPVIVSVLEEAGLYEGEHWEHNKTESLLTLHHNGSRIFMTSTEEPQHLRGQNCAFFWMDEPRDSPRIAFLNLQARLRQHGYPHQGWLTTTPLGVDHWIHRVFFPEEHADEEEAPAGLGTYLHYGARTRDNPFGGEELYQALIRNYGEGSLLARQELEGAFVVQEGLTYNWDPLKYIRRESEWPDQPHRVIAGIDFGFQNPTAILIEGLDLHGRRYLIAEYYRSHVDTEVVAEECAALIEKYGVRHFFADPQDAQSMSKFRRLGLPVHAAEKKLGRAGDLSSGIGLCARALAREIDGGQGFFVSPQLRHFKREIENYVREDWDLDKKRKNPTERPRALHDHLMDAWRYCEQGIIRLGWDDIRPERYKRPRSSMIPTRMAR